jgi:putative protein-disulfide isomerase
MIILFNLCFSQSQKGKMMKTGSSDNDSTITIEFYHDVLCAWCYALSPRVRKLAEQFAEVEVSQRGFALSPNKERISEVFGSKEEGKRQIIEHWRAANANDDNHRIKADLMEGKTFDYPHSMPALMACKAAELQGGQKAHWDYFDAVQKAHLTDCLNIDSPEVLIKVAASLNLNMEKFREDFRSTITKEAVELDLRQAQNMGIYSVPTIVINGKYKINGAVSYDNLKRAVQKIKN